MLVLGVRVGEGVQVGNAAFLQLMARDRDAITVQVTTRLPELTLKLDDENSVTISPRMGQRVKVAVSGSIAPVTITAPGIIPQVFALGLDGQARYAPRLERDTEPAQ